MTQTALSTAISEALFSYVLMAIIATFTAVVIRGIVLILARGRKTAQTAPTPVVVSVTPARDENAAIAAAIGAAVYTVLGAHRLVYIGEAERRFAWTSEIRSRLHTSHTPRR